MSEPQNDYSWAAYLDYMEGGGSDVVSLPVPLTAPRAEATPDQPVWGVLLALGLTLLAVWLNTLPVYPFSVRVTPTRTMHPIEPVMLALILGMVVSNVRALPKRFHSGIKFSVKKLLPLGIILLGARLHFGEMMKVGGAGLLLSLVETVVALSLLLVLARVMKLPTKLGMLLGVGTAICGGTAIVAAAPVIEAEDKDVVFSVATVTLLGLLAMFLLPILGHLMDMNSKQFGVWAGLAIHQTPQVVAAGYSYSPNHQDYSPVAGDTATIVKMARVCLLAPVVFLLGLWHARRKARQDGSAATRKINYLRLFPTFVLGFVAFALLNTFGLIPELTLTKATWLGAGVHTLGLGVAADQVSRFCIIISMAGVGLETRFAAMRRTGLKPFLASLLAVLVVAVMVLWLIRVLGI